MSPKNSKNWNIKSLAEDLNSKGISSKRSKEISSGEIRNFNRRGTDEEDFLNDNEPRYILPMQNINIQSNLGQYQDSKEPGSGGRTKQFQRKPEPKNILDYQQVEIDKRMEPFFNTNLHINGMP